MATTTMNPYDASPFREDQFPPVPERASEYYQAVQQGKQAMNQLRVVLAGLARNTASALPSNMLRAESLGNHFADYRVFIYENDSSDATPQLLDAWQRRNDRVVIQSESLVINRIARLAACIEPTAWPFNRGQCQSQLLNRWPDFDCSDLDRLGRRRWLEPGWNCHDFRSPRLGLCRFQWPDLQTPRSSPQLLAPLRRLGLSRRR